MLPEGTQLGNLRIVDVLDFYDGPKLFVARNTIGSYFLSLWADEDGQNNWWLYLPISQRQLDELYSGTLSIREAYIGAEENFVYSIGEPISRGGRFQLEIIQSSDLDYDLLPPEGDRLILEEPFSSPEDDVTYSDDYPFVHRITVAPRRRVDFSKVSKLLSAWTHTLAASVQRPIVPVAANVGSFIVDLGTEEGDGVENFFNLLHRYLQSNEELLATSNEEVVVLRRLYRLCNEVISSQLSLNASILGETSQVQDVVLTRSNVSELVISLQDYLTTRLLSTDVPQADDINRVFRVVELVSLGGGASGSDIDITPRQIAYYKQAARILGFLDEDNVITNQGRRLVSLGSVERLNAAKSAFETSKIGFAWLRWSEVISLNGIAPNSANEFLSESVVNLSENTIGRRAKTLRSWAQALI